MKNISRKNKSYSENTHFYGRIWSIVSVVMMMVFPIVAGIVFDAWPTASAIGIGIMGILIYWAAGAVEFISYTPLLGATSIYLGFVTGNLSNLKVPCALSCIDAENAKSNTDEGDIIATVSTAVSSIVTILVIIIGVILIAATPLADLLANPRRKKRRITCCPHSSAHLPSCTFQEIRKLLSRRLYLWSHYVLQFRKLRV